jgi:hypothetical protein
MFTSHVTTNQEYRNTPTVMKTDKTIDGTTYVIDGVVDNDTLYRAVIRYLINRPEMKNVKLPEDVNVTLHVRRE